MARVMAEQGRAHELRDQSSGAPGQVRNPAIFLVQDCMSWFSCVQGAEGWAQDVYKEKGPVEALEGKRSVEVS